MYDVVGVAEIECVGEGEDDLCDLGLIGASVQVLGGVELSSFAVLHDDVEEAGVIVDLVDLDDVGVF